MRRPPRLRLARLAALAASTIVAFLLMAGLAQALPATAPDNTGMVDYPGASGGNAVAVRTIQQFGANVWVGGIFNEIDDASGNKVVDASGMAVFDATSGTLQAGVHLPIVTDAGGAPEVYDMSMGTDGNLYLAGNFDHVDGQTRNGAAAINATTGQLVSGFHPNAGAANAVLATPSAIYVGTNKLLSFQLNGAATPGYTAPTAIIDASLRHHETLPQFRDIQLQGSTLVAACQCDSLTDANGTRTVKAVVEIDAATGNWVDWRPQNLPDSSGAFGISVIVHAYPTTGAPTVYLAAGGSDFTAAYDFNTNAQRFKTDTSGSSQALAWYQGLLLIGGHFDWTESPTVTQQGGSCGDNGTPNTQCYHTPKLAALNATTGVVLLNGANPWNPGICCKYNGVWALLTGTDGQMLHVGGEFVEVGGTWSGSGTNWSLTGYSQQFFYARLGGPASTAVPLTVEKSTWGGATGDVTSTPGGISCDVACTSSGPTDFNQNSSVTLSASPSSGNTFTGWSSAETGFDCPGTGTCTVTMDMARTVVANFAPISYQVTISKSGAGSGTVTSNPVGIDCGATCATFFAQNTVVTLTATAGPNSAFNGWSGAGCSGTGTCVVTVDAAKSVTADFRTTSHTLSVALTGAGSGSLLSNPSGINCGTTTCSHPSHVYNIATVTLTASASGGSVFTGWSGGGCSGVALTCVVTMDQDQTVSADFAQAKNVKLSGAGTGGGTVTSSNGAMNCVVPIVPGPTCNTLFAHNSNVTISATADGSSVFTGWSGSGSLNAGCTGVAPCTFNMGTAQKTVTATFQPGLLLTTTPAGSGGGTITSDLAGIDCGSACSANYLSGTVVTLSAAPDVNSTFTGWSGEGCAGAGTCVVPMSQARNVTATFTLVQRTLTVTVAGQGLLSDNPGPISCAGPAPDTGTCNASYQHGTDVLLIAVPVANWALTGWSGDCDLTDVTPDGDPFCVVSMVAAKSVTATFERINRTVAVTKAGSGTGTVTSDVSGIDCGEDCSEGYNQGDSVVLSAAADPGSIFTGWSGACTGTGTCNLTIDAAKNVVATFELLHTLTVTTDGPGTGNVTSDVGGIDCPATNCVAANRTHNTHVILTATPDPGSILAAWSESGCSAASLTCDVTMDSDKTVTATFSSSVTLTVSLAGAGGGTVTSPPGNEIDCPGTCTFDFGQDTSVTLTAAADGSSVFVGWSSTDNGFSCPGTGDCTVTMDQARTVTATFQPIVTLTVTKSGTGTGTVTSLAPNLGIDCGATCQFDFQQGVSVSLHASPDVNNTFVGWTGGGCSGTTDCVVTMNSAQSVNAQFDISPPPPTIGDNDPAIAYNGWVGVVDPNANGGAYRTSSIKSDKATWKSPAATSVTWVTYAGPDQGKAKVTIDGVNKGTFDLYAPSPGSTNKVFSGLSNQVHTVVVVVLHTKNTASSGFNVHLDAFVVGATTTQESDPTIQYDTWKSTAKVNATDGTYRSSAANTATATVTFTGTSIEWITAKGKAYGKAAVSIDGVPQGTVDLYQATNVWQVHLTYGGLSASPHTFTIQVLGQKNASATSAKVLVDGFVIHS